MRVKHEVAGTVHVVDPHGVYTREQLQQALGLRRETLRREIRLGRLRVAMRGGRYYFLGAWVLDWISAGELHKTAEEPLLATEG